MNHNIFNIVGNIDFPYPTDAIKIGIKMSGGLDSASMLYVLCDIKSKGLLHPETTLHPVTGVNWPRPYQEHFVNKTIDYVNSIFGENVPYTDAVCGGKDDDIGDVVNDHIEQRFKKREIDVAYIGETKFLPLDIINGTKWENAITKCEYFGNRLPFNVILDVTNPENTGYHHEDLYDRIWERGTDDLVFNKGSIAPYKNYHKGHVKQITDHYGISDKLLEITRSCEYSYLMDRKDEQMMEWEEHCEECLWCVERMVTYGRCQ
jgi:hypothetical protein